MKITNQNKSVLTLLLGILPVLLSAQSKKNESPVFDWIFDNLLFVVAGIVILGALIALWKLMFAFIYLRRKDFLAKQGIDIDADNGKPQVSFYSKLMSKAWSIAPISKESEIDLGHDYDGIRELDNNLPPWWLYGFYATILMAVGYLYAYEFSDLGASQKQEYEMAIEAGELQKADFAARQTNTLDEKNLVALTDEKSLEIGRTAYLANCVSCHLDDGGGSVGPNLTDKYWLHGGSIASIYQTIKYGVPEKGMIAWKAQLPPSTMHKIASYIEISLKGSTPKVPKDKQGILYEEIVESTNDDMQ